MSDGVNLLFKGYMVCANAPGKYYVVPLAIHSLGFGFLKIDFIYHISELTNDDNLAKRTTYLCN